MPKAYASVGTTETTILKIPDGKQAVITAIIVSNGGSSADALTLKEDGNTIAVIRVAAGDTEYLNNMKLDLTPGATLTGVAGTGALDVTVIYELK